MLQSNSINAAFPVRSITRNGKKKSVFVIPSDWRKQVRYAFLILDVQDGFKKIGHADTLPEARHKAAEMLAKDKCNDAVIVHGLLGVAVGRYEAYDDGTTGVGEHEGFAIPEAAFQAACQPRPSVKKAATVRAKKAPAQAI